MKKVNFKGIVNGVEFDNVNDYNARLEELIGKGASEITASSNTYITEEPDPVEISKNDDILLVIKNMLDEFGVDYEEAADYLRAISDEDEVLPIIKDMLDENGIDYMEVVEYLESIDDKDIEDEDVFEESSDDYAEDVEERTDEAVSKLEDLVKGNEKFPTEMDFLNILNDSILSEYDTDDIKNAMKALKYLEEALGKITE